MMSANGRRAKPTILMAALIAATTTVAAQPGSVMVSGTSLAYVSQGAGDPVVLVHGGLQDQRLWADHLPRFAVHFRAIAYSRRNHFPNPVSDAGTQDLAADLHGDDLAALLDALRLPTAHIVAHSSGAHAALFAAARHPDRVRSLALVEPPATGLLAAVADGPALLKAFADRFAPARAAFAQGDLVRGGRLFADGVGGPGTYDRHSASERAMMADNAAAHVADATSTRPRPQFTCAMAAQIRVPVLLVRGERSPEVFGAILDELARCLPNDERVVVAAASHTVPGENPEGFRSAVLAFLRAH